MMKLAVYGHYDSRGGTSAVVVSAFTGPERARADAVYNGAFGLTKTSKGGWSYDGPDGDPIDWPPPSADDQDWLGWALLDTGDLPIPEVGTDLDEDSETWVIAEGCQDDDFPEWNDADTPLNLRLIPAGKFDDESGEADKSGVPEGWAHPRWEDDAFGFLLC